MIKIVFSEINLVGSGQVTKKDKAEMSHEFYLK